MSKKNNDSKNSAWSDWAAKQNDWNMSNSKRPKLEIQRNHQSQSSITKAGLGASTVSEAGPSGAGRGGTFKRNHSMPTSSKSSPCKNVVNVFVDTAQEEFEAEEAVRLAAAVELQMAQSQLEQKQAATSSKHTNRVPYRNNGSSGFDNLFQEELAADVVEECMLLASQEIQASQNAAAAAGNSSFSQAYAVFATGVDAHSSVLDTGSNARKPPSLSLSSNSIVHQPPGISSKQSTRHPVNNGNVKFLKPPPGPLHTPVHLRKANNVPPQSHGAVNPQAEAEVRRLSKITDDNAVEIKKLKEALRSRDGEVSVLRGQIKQAVVERDQQKQRSIRSTEASERQYNEKIKDLIKELEDAKINLKFQEQEATAAKERNKLLLSNSVRIVEPQSPGVSAPFCGRTVGPPKTPSRHKHVSSFLNRSTFGEQLSPRLPPAKRVRLSDEEQEEMSVPPDSVATIYKPETRSVGEQTNLRDYDYTETYYPTLTLGQILSNKLAGIQLASPEFSKTVLWKNEDNCFDKKEPIPTLSLMKTGYKSRKSCDANRPSLVNCSQSLQNLMTWNDPIADCHSTRASILQIARECSGILHYNLLLLQDVGRPSNKELRDRDHNIFSRGSETLSLRTFDLLDDRQWYKEENGVEMRRCLGILSEIALVSSFAASLVTGFMDPNEAVIKRHTFLEFPEYAFVNQKVPVEEGDRFYLLKVLCDLCFLVMEQKITIAFNGVLAGILSLLKNCAQLNVLEERSEKYLVHIVRHILTARPSSYVLLLVVDLLTSVGGSQIVMRGLCTMCDDDDNVFESTPGLCSFTRDSCALQLLCIQLVAVTERNRWRLIDSVSKWLIKVIAQGPAAPSWILSADSNNQSHVACCIRFTTTLILLLSDAFRTLQEILETKECSSRSLSDSYSNEVSALESILIRIMRRGIIILFKLVENHIFQFMARVEGLYELLVQGIVRFRKRLSLTPILERYLEDLLRTEQETASPPGEQTTSDNCNLNLYFSGVTGMLKLS